MAILAISSVFNIKDCRVEIIILNLCLVMRYFTRAWWVPKQILEAPLDGYNEPGDAERQNLLLRQCQVFGNRACTGPFVRGAIVLLSLLVSS